MTVDPKFGNSSGYFKDPLTGEDLTCDTPRVVECRLEDGKFIWPCVLRSDGDQPIRIVYRLFTEEEKKLYAQYRGREPGKVREPREPKEPKEPRSPSARDVPVYDATSTASAQTLLELARCDCIYGVANIGGLYYVMCGIRGKGTQFYIPRDLIPDDEFERLCA